MLFIAPWVAIEGEGLSFVENEEDKRKRLQNY